MLVSSFRGAGELGLEPRHWDALVEVLRRLEAGEIEYRRPAELVRIAYLRIGPGLSTPDAEDYYKHFNMAAYVCGTACCIAGWAGLISKDPQYFFEAEPDRKLPRALVDLFFWRDGKTPIGLVRVPEAAAALRRYLETGYPFK